MAVLQQLANTEPKWGQSCSGETPMAWGLSPLLPTKTSKKAFSLENKDRLGSGDQRWTESPLSRRWSATLQSSELISS